MSAGVAAPGMRASGGLARQFAAALAGSFGLRLGGMLVAFVVGVQLARYLGVEQFGIYGYAMAVVSVASIAACGGVQILALREASMAAARSDWPMLAAFARWLLPRLVLVAIPVTLLALAWLAIAGAAPPPLLAAAAILVLALVMVKVGGAMVRALGRIVWGQGLETLVQPLVQALLLLGAFLLLGRLSAAQALMLTATAAVLTAAVALGWLGALWPAPARTAVPAPADPGWARAALPMWATTILFVLDAHAPVLFLGLFAPAAELGQFRVAVASLVLVAFPYTLLTGFLPPIAARVVAEGGGLRQQRLAAAAALAGFAATASITGFLWVFGEWLIGTLFGPDYRPAWLPLMLIAAGSLWRSILGVPVIFLFAAGREWTVTSAFALGLLLCVLLLLLLAPAHGSVGAALAILGSMAVRDLLLAWRCRVEAGVNPTLLGAGCLLPAHRAG